MGIFTDGHMKLTRRLFIKASAFFWIALAIPKTVWAFFVRLLRTRTVEQEAFVFDPIDGTIHWRNSAAREPYRLVVEGLVEKPRAFSYEELLNLPQVVQSSDFHCVEGWSVKDIRWGGIRFSEIAGIVQPKPEARYVVFHSLGTTAEPAPGVDHYIESLPLERLLDPGQRCLLALRMDDAPLTFDRGSPLRVVSPYDLGYKGAKYVTRVVFSAEQTPGWWTLANPIYPVDAPVPAERLKGR
ncbi:MAG: molybdopterin-dependent oxidoreductase [Deltaproteobacteria bacterium]|nr:molybdopterin-dependent oxidoreductase [Deltaproteobacteria bacterium]